MSTTRVSRLKELQHEDRSELDALIDGSIVCHVGLIVDEGPVVVPTAIARHGDVLLAHGSVASPWMRRAAQGGPACVAVTALDAVIVARTAFESSLRYRSAVVFGRFARLEGDDKARSLDAFIEKLIPGRGPEVRPSTPEELRQTMVLAMPIDTWSLKVSDGWPDDAEGDVAGPTWAGVVPFETTAGPPLRAPDLRSDIPVPPSVRALCGEG